MKMKVPMRAQLKILAVLVNGNITITLPMIKAAIVNQYTVSLVILSIFMGGK